MSVDLLRVSPLPADIIGDGLSSVRSGITSARGRIERLTREREREVGALVDTEYKLRALAVACKHPRPTHRADLPPCPARDHAAETADSLLVYALTSVPETRRPLDDAEAWRRILRVG